MDKAVKIAVILSAYDRMSEVIAKATGKANQRIAAMRDSSKQAFAAGFSMTGAAAAGIMSLAPVVSAYADLEDASTSLQSQMMDANGKVSSYFNFINQQAIELGNRLPGTTADFQELYKAILEQGVSAQSILKGTGKAAAYLAVDAKMGYTEAGVSAAKLREATGVADDQMEAFIDTISRTKNVGVSVSEMIYSFARSAGALKNVKLQGLEASQGIAAIYAMLIRSGMSGETVGTGFTSILSSFYDAKKMGKFNEATRQYGIQLDFVDKRTGAFKGISNMMAQLDKLRGLDTQQRMNVVQALLGPGQDAGMFSILVEKGVGGFRSMQGEMARQASLNQKVEVQLRTLKNTWEAATGTFTNTLAAVGSAFAPELKKIVDLLSKIAEKAQAFATAHPTLIKSVVLIIAVGSAFIGLVGAINIVKGAWLAFQIILNANPWMAIIAGIVIVATLIYSNWGAIKAWVIKTFESIVAFFRRFFNYVWNLFLNYTPYGLIIKHWGKIVVVFRSIFDRVKALIIGHVNFVLNIGTRFYQAGKNVVLSLVKGIKDLAFLPINVIKGITKKMRDYLPFSPAREGAFRDLHKVKIVETLVSAIRPEPLFRAMGSLAGMAINGFQHFSGIGGKSPVSGSGGTVTINYSPVINGVAGPEIMLELRKHDRELLNLFAEAQRKRDRTTF